MNKDTDEPPGLARGEQQRPKVGSEIDDQRDVIVRVLRLLLAGGELSWNNEFDPESDSGRQRLSDLAGLALQVAAIPESTVQGVAAAPDGPPVARWDVARLQPGAPEATPADLRPASQAQVATRRRRFPFWILLLVLLTGLLAILVRPGMRDAMPPAIRGAFRGIAIAFEASPTAASGRSQLVETDPTATATVALPLSYSPVSLPTHTPMPVPTTAPSPTEVPAPTPAPTATPPFFRYVVQPGESLTVIARRYGTTSEQLARINNLANANLIEPGQALLIPR